MDRILLVDDDREVLKINQEFFEGKGYQVKACASAQEALREVTTFLPHCIVLDVMMPGIDGFEALSQLRKTTQVPVIFLTGRTEEADRIQGLMLGAVDYVLKPCSLEELALRIQIHITRYRGVTGQTGILEFPPLRIELLNHRVLCRDEEILLSNKEYELLVCLAKHNREVMTFERIGKELLGGYIDADRRNIMMNASRLRKKMEGYVGLENMIETVWGKGYSFRG
ncbi:MAG: response regulator transcription factor [Lachnospiraceae bacterium]|jgi:DNA-binding response OmpR family regulator|nr:response regulator transcription factor [Lachnospiraceae bacterium]MCR5498921.1 response regulator transcription factor [Acetatifactor sp.]MBO7338469.1 response regulator transcription factor [Lachnospiraceae bacterium]MBP5262949.1 response regulator transcription factor [Lachnospiraceae bacterium]MBP5670324.1 response regulator transcription factor [Lachnospiraceae bacterium]